MDKAISYRRKACGWNGVPPYPCVCREDAINRIKLVTTLLQKMNGRTCTIGDFETKVPVELLNTVWVYLEEYVESVPEANV